MNRLIALETADSPGLSWVNLDFVFSVEPHDRKACNKEDCRTRTEVTVAIGDHVKILYSSTPTDQVVKRAQP